MFDDLIPAASAQTPPPPLTFDDLIPAGGAGGGIARGRPASVKARSGNDASARRTNNTREHNLGTVGRRAN